MYAIISFILAVVSLVLGFSALDQHRINRRTYQLAWSIALFVSSATSLLWFALEVLPINAALFRLWFFGGAMAVPVAFAAGMLFLVAPRRVAWVGIGVSGGVAVIGLILTLVLGFETPARCAAAHPGLTGLDCLASSSPLTGFGYFHPVVSFLALALFVYSLLVLLAGGLWAGAGVVLGQSQVPADQAPDGSVALVSRAEVGRLVKSGQFIGVFKVFFNNLDFWNRDRQTRRAVGTGFIALGAIVSTLGLILGLLGFAAIHLWLIFLAALLIFVGLVAIQDVFEVDPLAALRPTAAAGQAA